MSPALFITLSIVTCVVLFIAFILVIVIGGNIVGRASGSAELDDADPQRQKRAMLRLISAGGVFVLLIIYFDRFVEWIDHLWTR